MQSLLEVENIHRSCWLSNNNTNDIYDVYAQFQIFIKSEYVHKLNNYYFKINIIKFQKLFSVYSEYQAMKKFLRVWLI